MKRYEKIWIVGDGFVHGSFEDYRNKLRSTYKYSYTTNNFEVSHFSSNEYNLPNPSLMGSVRGNILKGIREQTILPKMIIIVMDET